MRRFLISSPYCSRRAGCSCKDKKTQEGCRPRRNGARTARARWRRCGAERSAARTRTPGWRTRAAAIRTWAATIRTPGIGIDPADPARAASAWAAVPMSRRWGCRRPIRTARSIRTRYVKGVIKIHAKAKGRATAGGAGVRDRQARRRRSGQPTGTAARGRQADLDDGELPFELTEAAGDGRPAPS